MRKRKGLYFLLFLSFVLEAGSLSFLRPIMGLYLSPLLFFAAGLFSIWVGLQMLQQVRLRRRKIMIDEKKFSSYDILNIVFFAFLFFIGWKAITGLFDNYKIDPTQSDIIPLIKVMVARLQGGQPVYAPVNDFGYTMYPNYLPATWLPFWVAQKLGIDYRLWAYILFAASVVLALVMLPFKKTIYRLLGLASLSFVIALYRLYQPSALGLTIEPMIAGFYLLLATALYKRRPVLIATCLLLCLLSRYAIVMFVPFWLGLLFFNGQRKLSVQIGLLLLFGLVTLLFIPFVMHNPELLKNGYAYYTTGALAEWKGQSWQAAGALPFQLSQGYGLAIYFYQLPGELTAKLKALQWTHLLLTLAVPIITCLWYHFRAKRWLPIHWFLLLSLKIYLVFFFSFIQVPYAYLFITPLLVSGLVCSLLFHHYREAGKKF